MREKVFARTIIGTEQEVIDRQLICNVTVDVATAASGKTHPFAWNHHHGSPSNSWFAKVTIPHWHSPSLGSKIRSREHQI
jgi:hypothetical protein